MHGVGAGQESKGVTTSPENIMMVLLLLLLQQDTLLVRTSGRGELYGAYPTVSWVLLITAKKTGRGGGAFAQKGYTAAGGPRAGLYSLVQGMYKVQNGSCGGLERVSVEID